MQLWISWFISGILNLLIWSDFYIRLNNKYSKLNFKIILGALLTSIIGTITIFGFPAIINTVLKYILFFLYFKFIYKDKISKLVLSLIGIYLLLALSELMFGIFFFVVFKFNPNFFQVTFVGVILSNVLVLIIFSLLGRLNIVLTSFRKFIKWWDNRKNLNLMAGSFLAVIILAGFLYYNYLNFSSNISYIIVNIIFLGIIYFIFGFYMEKTKKNKLLYEYNQLNDYLKELEIILSDKAKLQHEHNNQLLVIKDLGKSNKKIGMYIDRKLQAISSNQTNSAWELQLNKIPIGGLQGLLYYKLKQMREKDVNVSIFYGEKFDFDFLKKMVELNLEDLTIVFGVLLDNALEASIESKNKLFSLEMYSNDKEVEIVFSNTYANSFNVSKINTEGYSTKGKNRGHGLKLVNDVLKKYPHTIQTKEFVGEMFCYKLKISRIKKD